MLTSMIIEADNTADILLHVRFMWHVPFWAQEGKSVHRHIRKLHRYLKPNLLPRSMSYCFVLLVLAYI